MRMRGLSKSANRTSRLIYGFCKPCTVIGLSREWREANRRTKCEIIQERQIEFRRAYISSRLDFKISSAAIIISTRRFGRYAQTFSDYFGVSLYKTIYFKSLQTVSLVLQNDIICIYLEAPVSKSIVFKKLQYIRLYN